MLRQIRLFRDLFVVAQVKAFGLVCGFYGQIFQILDIGFCHGAVLGDENQRFLPESLVVFVVLDTLPEVLRFSQIRFGGDSVVFAQEYVKCGTVQLLPFVDYREGSPWNDQHFAYFIAYENGLCSLRISVYQIGGNRLAHIDSYIGDIKNSDNSPNSAVISGYFFLTRNFYAFYMILYQPVVVDYEAKFRPGSFAAVTCRCVIVFLLIINSLQLEK